MQPQQQPRPRFHRDLLGESEAFVSGYNEAQTKFGQGTAAQLDPELTRRTLDCKNQRRFDPGENPLQDRREGARAAVHDAYYSELYTKCPQDELDMAISRLGKGRGVRAKIIKWAREQRKPSQVAPSKRNNGNANGDRQRDDRETHRRSSRDGRSQVQDRRPPVKRSSREEGCHHA